MKKIVFALLLTGMIFSCRKKEEAVKINLCNSAECEQYFVVWKSIFLKKNNMSEDYFNAHILPTSSSISNWNSGSSFNVQYQVKIDWMTCKLADQFIIRTAATETIYPALDIRRGEYLSETEIERALTMRAFSSEMNTVKPLDHLSFATEEDALIDMKINADSKEVKLGNPYYNRDMFNSPASGEPMLGGYVESDRKNNKCKSIQLNLITSDCQVLNSACWVN